MNRLLIKQTSNRRKYCSSCWKDINREQIRKRVQKHRQRNALENPANLHE
jgi:hypothetical protein